MKKELEIILAALNAGNKGGLFTLQESNAIIQSFTKIEQVLTPPEVEEKKAKK